MRNTQIYISNQLVDLSPTTFISVSFQLSDVTDPTTRIANYTNQITLPKTNNNKQIFGLADDEKSTTNAPYIKLPVTIVQKGVTIVDNASAIITSSNDSFNLEIYSGIYNFFTGIENKYLSDIDTTTFDTYPGNTNSILDQPFINYGALDATQNPLPFSGKEFFSVPYSKILDLIITKNGYTKSGNIFSDSKLNAMHLSALGFGPLKDGFAIPKEFLALRDTTVVFSASDTTKRINFTKVVIPSSFYDNTNIYTVHETNYGGTYFWFNAYASVNFASIVFSGGATKLSVRLVSGSATYTRLITATGTYTFELSDSVGQDPTGSPVTRVVGVDGSFLFMDITTVNNLNTPTGAATITFGDSKFYNKVITDKILYSSLLYTSVQAILPRYLQTSFLKDFAVRFGVMFKEKDNVLYCKTIKDIINDRAHAVDWTSKRDTRQEQLTYTFGDYAQSNIFLYANTDTDMLSQGSLNIANTNLEKTNVLFQSDFNKCDTIKMGNEVAGYVTAAYIPAFELQTYELTVIKQPCRYKTRGNHSLTGLSVLNGDPYVPAASNQYRDWPCNDGDRILVTDNTNQIQNGIWISHTGAWTRATDADSASELDYALVNITDGYYTQRWFYQTRQITVGSQANIWVESDIYKSYVRPGDSKRIRSIDKNEDPGIVITLVRDKYASEPTLQGGNSTYKVAYFDDALALTLNFQSFVDSFYSEFQQALQKPKVVTRMYNLTEMDIFNLDLFNLVYDDGSYFIIDKVSYVPDQLSKADLLKVS